MDVWELSVPMGHLSARTKQVPTHIDGRRGTGGALWDESLKHHWLYGFSTTCLRLSDVQSDTVREGHTGLKRGCETELLGKDRGARQSPPNPEHGLRIGIKRFLFPARYNVALPSAGRN